MNHARISIIFPVTGSENAALQWSLDSILKQTLPEIEVICVVSGSGHALAETLRGYAERDERIKIITLDEPQPDGGKNAGIAGASGEYLIFLDVGDCFSYNACETMLNKAVLHHADAVKTGAVY